MQRGTRQLLPSHLAVVIIAPPINNVENSPRLFYQPRTVVVQRSNTIGAAYYANNLSRYYSQNRLLRLRYPVIVVDADRQTH